MVDPAVQLLGSYYRELFALVAQAGASELVVRSPGRDALWRQGRGHAVTYGSVARLALSGALPPGLKLRLAARYLPYLHRHAAALDPREPARAAGAGLDRESIAEWGRREIGKDFVELLAHPLLAAYYASAPAETSAGFYHALAEAGREVAVYAVRGGMGALAAALAGALHARGAVVHTGTRIEEIVDRGDSVELSWTGGTARHDAVVVATTAPVAASLLAATTPVAGWLAGVRQRPTASLALRLDRPVPADYFGLCFTPAEPAGRRIAAICVQERKGARLVPDGGLVVVLPAPETASRMAGAAPADALELARPALEEAFPGFSSWIVRAKLYRFRDGVPVFYPGYLEHLHRFPADRLPERIALAGDYLVAPTVEGAVISGRRAAERLLARAAQAS